MELSGYVAVIKDYNGNPSLDNRIYVIRKNAEERLYCFEEDQRIGIISLSGDISIQETEQP